MYKRVNLKKLGRKKSHRDALIKNQLRSLFTNGYLTTTSVKAKVLRGKALSLITDIKKSTDAYNLQKKLNMVLGSRQLSELAMTYSKKEDAKITLRKFGFRAGDNAEVSKVELVGFEKPKKEKRVKKEKVEAKKVVEKKETKKVETRKQSGLGSKIKSSFTGRKERSRTRSGL